MATLITRHPVRIYTALTFAISWGGIFVAMGPGGIPRTREALQQLLPVAITVMIVGPSIAGLVLTGLVHGRAGFRELRSRLIRWRVGARWYAVALLTAPLVSLALLGGFSFFSPGFQPGLFASDDKASRLLSGVAAGVPVGVFEELGWTGFAVPTLRRRHHLLTTGLIVGVIWGAWHIMATVLLASGTYSGALSWPVFFTARALALLVGQLPAYRVLMVWVDDRTGSLLVAMLMHASLTASTLILEPIAISGAALLIFDLASTIVWWGLVAALAVAHGWQPWRRPLPT